ncbi:hypothetical protein [Microbacterium testaceum]|uniref:hypothetical protein n=1 Tax=Microbacterium testaceum TaxID=2033 RepID=UPI002AC427A5|nr:hypothetical protein [Microbacterium testaceum]MDZ5146121.1 hypothetical protein [Microbacterium testaceum]
MTEHDPHSPGNTFTDGNGIKRRTIIAGAAWTIPVVALATATPAMAASNDLTLAFDKSSYQGVDCGTISGVKVTATRNGQAAPGESITVSLADGYTFSDGSTSYTTTSGSDGSVTLPDIKVPQNAGSSTFTATGGGATATASVSSTSNAVAYSYNGAANQTNQETNVPNGATPVGWRSFIDSSGSLWDNGVRIRSDVASAVGLINGNGDHLISYVTKDGVAYSFNGANGQTSQETNVPNGAKPVGWRAFLESDGSLWDNGIRIRSDVASAIGLINADGSHLISYVTKGGVAYSFNGTTGQTGQEFNVPNGATPVGWRAFLEPNGSLWDNGNRIRSDVASAYGLINSNGDHLISYVTKDGVALSYNGGNGQTNQETNVPNGAKPVGWRAFLEPNGSLWDNGVRIRSDVTKARGLIYMDNNNAHLISYVTGHC